MRVRGRSLGCVRARVRVRVRVCASTSQARGWVRGRAHLRGRVNDAQKGSHASMMAVEKLFGAARGRSLRI